MGGAAALFISLFFIYLWTLAPGLTWTHDGSDSGDLITAASTGGIAHPTGYPLYLLLASLFQALPVGSLAYRTNLMSAFFTVLAAALIYRLVIRAQSESGDPAPWPAGLAAGLAFGLTPLAWSQAVITEVHALQAFLVAVILDIYTRPAALTAPRSHRQDAWRGLLLGLALGNHLTTTLLVPPALFLGSLRREMGAEGLSGAAQPCRGRYRFERGTLLRQLVWLGLGLCIYLVLPLRALSDPPVNWGNPVTLERFWWLVSGGVYRSYYLPEGLPDLMPSVRALAALLLEQFGLAGVTLGTCGLLVFSRTSRLLLLTAWTALAFGLFAILYQSNDSYVYLIPVVLSFALWIGIGATGLSRALSRHYPKLGAILGVIVAGYFSLHAVTYFNRVDASRDRRAEDFGHDVLSTTPENALVFAKGDRAIFALWYFHYGLGQRPDLAVIAAELLHFDWYQDTLRSTYPGLSLMGPFPWPESVAATNPTRPACYVQYTNRTEIECISPRLTP